MCVYVCVSYRHVLIRTHSHMHIYTQILSLVHTYTNVHTRMHARTHAHTHTHTHTHAHTRTRTHTQAIEGNYIDHKCPFTGTVSIRGRILTGVVRSKKMNRTIVIRRNYLHYVRKYNRFEKRHKNVSVHMSPCFRWVRLILCSLHVEYTRFLSREHYLQNGM